MIAKHEFSQGQWAELNQFILENCNSSNPGQREVGGAKSSRTVAMQQLQVLLLYMTVHVDWLAAFEFTHGHSCFSSESVDIKF